MSGMTANDRNQRPMPAAWLVGAVIAAAAPMATGAVLIDNTEIDARASSWHAGDRRNVDNAVKGNGLSFSATVNDYVHVANPNNTQWLTDYANNPVAADSWMLVDLGTTYALHSIRVWNYNEAGQALNGTGRGVKDAKIWVTTTGTIPEDSSGAFDFASNGWTQVGSGIQFAQAPGTDDYVAPPENTVSLGGITARYVAIDVDSRWVSAGGNAGKEVGLAEVQFFAVPEPASMALLGVGGLALLRRARRGDAAAQSE